MGKTIGLISIKGGVGKTTLSAAVASELATGFGKKVLLVDANYSAPNLGIHMNIISPRKTVHDVLAGGVKTSAAIHKQYGVDVIPGNFLFKRDYNVLKLRNKLSTIKGRYDFVIIDASPSLNDELYSAMIASDALFVVSTPDYPTLSCSMKAARVAKQRDRPIEGIILNKVRGRMEVEMEEIHQSTGIPVVARIMDDKKAHSALFERTPLTLHDRGSVSAREVRRLCGALVGEKEKRSLLSRVIGRDMKQERVNREILKESFHKRERKKK